MGSNCRSAIATLVERQTRYCLLVGLPDGYRAELVAAALIKTIQTLPAHLRRSLTWDQGIEMMHHSKIKIATDLDIYFCDPHSPWQRGSNENTNGLLRQYFRLVLVAAMAWSGQLPVTSRRTSGGLTRVLPAAHLWLARFGCVVPTRCLFAA